jgi:hypothetical protein
MVQRDYEEQPEAPDLGASAQLESEDHLASPAGDRDILDAGYVPADRPYMVDDEGVTARGMREGDTLEERLRRERGDEPVDPDRSGRLAVEGQGAALETPNAMDAADVGLNGGAAGAEEAAVHVVDDVQGVTGREAMDEPSEGGEPTDREEGGEPAGADVTGRGPDPAWPQDPTDVDPAQRPYPDRDAARRIDESPDTGGSGAAVSGWQDVGSEEGP